MLKKIIYGIVNFISVVIIAAAIVVLIMVLLTKPGKPPSIGGFTLLRITTGSMVPTYDVDTMILDKTGTITFGNRLAADFLPVDGADRSELIRCAA